MDQVNIRENGGDDKDHQDHPESFGSRVFFHEGSSCSFRSRRWDGAVLKREV